MLRRLLFAALALGIVVSIAVLVYRSTKEDSEREIVIGAVLPMTGDAGTFGQNAFRGAELAIEQAGELGILKGKNVRLVVEDSRGAAQDAANATRKLIDIDHAVVLIGDVTSAGTQAMIPLITDQKIPLISPAASDPSLSNVSPYFLRLWPSDVYEAEIIASHAKAKGYRRTVIVYANTDYGVGMEKEFVKAAPGAVIASIPVDRESLDYRPTLQRIISLGADSLFIILYPEDARRLLQQAQEQGLSLPILATATIEDPMISGLQIAFSIVFASPKLPDEADVKRKSFVDAYRVKYGAEPGVLSDIGYDCAILLMQALQHEPVSKPERLVAYIKSLKEYKGVSGTISFRPTGDIEKPYALKSIRDGAFTWLPDSAQ